MKEKGKARRTANSVETVQGRVGNPDKTKPHRWLPGQSGNPTGRPKSLGPMIRHDTEEGRVLVEALMGIAQEVANPSSARVSAINTLLERGWGKAPQAVAGNEEEWRKLAAAFLGCDESEVPELG